ncbi:HSP20-like chaperone [Lipomyces arxii]|uniref:HSP20-like chaperone n=1 Tax=Lipomyces arxii TaxID=56418 RepID=UPI0034CE5B8C
MSLSRFLRSTAPQELFYPSQRLMRMFDDPFFTQGFETPLASSLANTAFTRTPSFDVKETEKEFVLQGELPGVESKNLNIEFLDPQTLSVKGVIEKSHEYNQPTETKAAEVAQADTLSEAATMTEVAKSDKDTTVGKPTYWASERVYGEFSRSFRFPTRVDPDNVSASLKNGILNVTIPKVGETPAKRIEVASE